MDRKVSIFCTTTSILQSTDSRDSIPPDASVVHKEPPSAFYAERSNAIEGRVIGWNNQLSTVNESRMRKDQPPAMFDLCEPCLVYHHIVYLEISPRSTNGTSWMSSALENSVVQTSYEIHETFVVLQKSDA